MVKVIILCVSSLLVWLPCSGQSQVPSHAVFDELLHKHVTLDGRVNYLGFVKDSITFSHYLRILSEHPPQSTWSVNERKAFWINAYNAFTIKLIIDNYPVKSIKDLGGWIYKVNTPWDIQFLRIGSETMDLNNIEHDKLRADFDDPRIHFAIVCASKSCPKLVNASYEAASLESQLDQAARDFLSDTSRNKIATDQLEISSIFKWYRGDFTKSGSLVDYINNYTTISINSNARISFLDYDWTLNE